MGGSCKNKTAQHKDEISREDVVKELDEAADTALAYLSEERRELVNSYEAQVEHAESQIEKMKEEIKSVEAAVRQDYQQKIHLLESQVAYVKHNMSELVESSGQAWEDLSTGLDSAMVDLDRAIAEAKAEFLDL
jgi:CRISPR/Cas system-associated protein Cas10 (large subunit of type III CRISPR-Cas system)